MNQKGAVHRTAQCVLSQGGGCEAHANKTEFPCFLLRKLSVTQSAKTVCSELQISHAVGSRNSPPSPALSGGSCLPPSAAALWAPLAECNCSTVLLHGSVWGESDGQTQQIWMRARSLFQDTAEKVIQLSGVGSSDVRQAWSSHPSSYQLCWLCAQRTQKLGLLKGLSRKKSRLALVLVSSGFYLCLFFLLFYSLVVYIYSIMDYNVI